MGSFMRSRSMVTAFLSAAALLVCCLAGGVGPAASSAAAVSSATSTAKASPATSVQLSAPVSQQPAAYTPDVYAGGNCSTFCPTSGAPYQSKPRFWMDAKGYEEAKCDAFRMQRAEGTVAATTGNKRVRRERRRRRRGVARRK